MKKKRLVANWMIIVVVGFALQACNQRRDSKQENVPSVMHDKVGEALDSDRITKAVCDLHPTGGNDVTGTVTFSQSGAGVVVVADVEGLTPGKHGFHIHQYGDCSSLDATSAGGHFNPDEKQHGAPAAEMRHVGDLGNLEADQNGRATYEQVDSSISLNGDHSIIGRAIIVHAGEDDLTSQPTGNAGARVACGVIGISQE